MKNWARIAAMGIALRDLRSDERRLLGASVLPQGDDTVDLTPKFKAGQTITFKQHTVRKDTMTVGNLPATVKPEEKAGDGGKGDGGKDAVKGDSSKPEPSKADPSKDGKAGADQPGVKPTTMNSMSSTQTMDQTATYELRVVEAGEKGAVLELQLKAISASGELAQGKFSWDSSSPPDDKDANNPILTAFRPIVGAVLKIHVGPDGNITGVDGDPQVNLNVRGSLSPNVQALVGPDGVRLRWGSVLWIKDGRQPATVGQSWSNTDEMLFPAVGKFTYTTNNTMKSVKNDIADIAITGEVKLGAMPDGKAPSGTLRDHSIKGSCQWDVKAGAIKSHTCEQKQALDINANGIPLSRVSEFTVTTTRE